MRGKRVALYSYFGTKSSPFSLYEVIDVHPIHMEIKSDFFSLSEVIDVPALHNYDRSGMWSLLPGLHYLLISILIGIVRKLI